MCIGSGCSAAMAAAVSLLVCACVVNAAESVTTDARVVVLPELADHPALPSFDLQHCGTGAETQISRGPLGCGFPVVGDHPWLVALGYRSVIDGSLTFRCSGALISDSMVVTSARCAVGSETMRLSAVRVGEYNLTSPKDCLWHEPSVCVQVQEAGVERVLLHPEFFNIIVPGNPSVYDIAVVKLDRKITIDYGAIPICLPMFPDRHPPKIQFSLTFGLHTQPENPAPSESDSSSCTCSRNRNITFQVMDEERLVDYDAIYNGTEPCQYRLLSEGGDTGTNRCLGSGTPCMADLGAPLVAADVFGSAFFLIGVTTSVPYRQECLQTSGASVFHLPVQMHLKWILDSVHCLENESCFTV